MDRIYVAGFDVFYPDWREKRYLEYRLYAPDMVLRCRRRKRRRMQGRPWENKFFSRTFIVSRSVIMWWPMSTVSGAGNPDSGTCFEIGYAYALGKKIYGYLDDTRTMMEKIGGETDQDGFLVENFDLPVNLMLGCSMTLIQGNLEHCLQEIRRREGKG